MLELALQFLEKEITMFNKLFRKIIFGLFLFLFSFNNIYSQANTNPVPYEEDEFPLWAKDLRRAEIISLGSLPFVTIGVSLGYGAIQYFSGKTDTFPNPFNKSSNAFTSEQQLQIFGISVGVSCLFGLTDYIVSVTKRNQLEKKDKINKDEYKIIVTPVNDEEIIFSREKKESEKE